MKRSASDKMTSKRGLEKQQSKRNVVASLDPVLKDLHAKLMGIINDSHKRLVAAVEEELRKAKVNIDRQRKQQLSEGDGDGDNDGQDGDGDNDGKASYEDEATVGTPITISEFHGESATTEGGTNESQQSFGSHPVEQKDEPWRSQRSKKPKKIMSPWTLTKPLKCRKKEKEEKEMFFDIISRTYTTVECQH